MVPVALIEIELGGVCSLQVAAQEILDPMQERVGSISMRQGGCEAVGGANHAEELCDVIDHSLGPVLDAK